MKRVCKMGEGSSCCSNATKGKGGGTARNRWTSGAGSARFGSGKQPEKGRGPKEAGMPDGVVRKRGAHRSGGEAFFEENRSTVGGG